MSVVCGLEKNQVDIHESREDPVKLTEKRSIKRYALDRPISQFFMVSEQKITKMGDKVTINNLPKGDSPEKDNRR